MIYCIAVFATKTFVLEYQISLTKTHNLNIKRPNVKCTYDNYIVFIHPTNITPLEGFSIYVHVRVYMCAFSEN